MLDREATLKTIEDIYAARVRGDRAAVARCWAPGGTFRLASDMSHAGDLPLRAEDPMQTIGALIERFEFSDLAMQSAVIEGNRAAVHWEVTVRCGEKRPVRTEMMDLIAFNDAGKVQSLVQFVDTAAMLRLVQ